MKIFHTGFNYSQDGEGNRLVIHMTGCNMRCPWCANPEGMSPGGVITADSPLSDGYCPHGYIKDGQLNREGCAICRTRECLTKYKNTRMGFSSHELSLLSLTQLADSARLLFFDGGGVTFTGGEPTLQFDALSEALSALKTANFNTAVETNASHPRLTDLIPLIDHMILDLKHYDTDKHLAATGMGNAAILSNIVSLTSRGIPLLLRTPLIHGFNDGTDDEKGFVSFYKTLNTDNVRFELLSYHEYGKVKWAQCGKAYAVSNGYVSSERLQQFETAYRAAGLNVVKT